MEKRKKIVLTGGPCAGKTTIINEMAQFFRERLQVVPESATLLFKGGFPRWPEDKAKAALQTAVFRVQVELERSFSDKYPNVPLLLDRGTLDGAVYWPGDNEGFFQALQTSLNKELSRYDRVIFLRCADHTDYIKNAEPSVIRNETWQQAKKIDEAMLKIWSQHSNISVISRQEVFADKSKMVLDLIEKEI
jgi:predicted ATPase